MNKKPTRCTIVLKSLKPLLYSYSALHVSGTLAPIIRSLLILHIHPPVTLCRSDCCIFYLWSVTAWQTKVGRYKECRKSLGCALYIRCALSIEKYCNFLQHHAIFSLLVHKYSLRHHAALKGWSNYQFVIEYSPKIRYLHPIIPNSKCVSTKNPTTEPLIECNLSETPKSRIAEHTYSASLRAGRFSVQTPVGTTDFFITAPLPPPPHEAHLYNGYRGSFPESKANGASRWPPPPSDKIKVKVKFAV
jgi:hypothetical protein